MENVQLSGVNQTYINNQKSDTNVAPAKEVEVKKDGNKKLKLALLALAATGAAIAAGVVVKKRIDTKALEGISRNYTAINSKGQNVVVTFPDKNGVAKVKKELFTGTLKQVRTKDDKTIETLVEYVDGKPIKTTIDGVVKKTFEHGTDGSTTIQRLGEDGAVQKLTTIYKDEKGRARRIFEKLTGDEKFPFGKATDYENGKLRATTKFTGTEPNDIECVIFDDEGKIAKTIRKEDNYAREVQNGIRIDAVNPDGSTKAIAGALGLDDKSAIENLKSKSATSIVVDDPRYIGYYTKEGAVQRQVSVSELGKGKMLSDVKYDPDGIVESNTSIVTNPNATELDDDRVMHKGHYIQLKDGINKDEIRFCNGEILKTKYAKTPEDKASFLEKIKKAFEEIKENGLDLGIPQEEIETAIAKI